VRRRDSPGLHTGWVALTPRLVCAPAARCFLNAFAALTLTEAAEGMEEREYPTMIALAFAKR
jgi:hypothetical protein